MSQMNDAPEVKVDEQVVLSKFDGDSTHPDDEVERLVIDNGLVVQHVEIKNREVVGDVKEGNLTGTDIGRLIPNE